MTPTGLTDWRLVCTDLWSRAARFSHIVGASDGSTPRPAKSGFFFYSDLDAIEDGGPHAEAWWWIYLPLLRRLLAGEQDSTAYLIGLGHHLQGAPDAEPKRDWVHFLPGDFERPENRDALNHLLLTASYNASLPVREEGKVPLLLSTRLLEHFNTPKYMLNGEIPTLNPLVLDFDAEARGAPALTSLSTTGTNTGIDSQASSAIDARYPAIVAGWSSLRARIAKLDPTNLHHKQITDQARDICGGQVEAAFQRKVLDPATPRLPCLAPDDITKEFRRFYRTAMAHRHVALCQDTDVNKILFETDGDRFDFGHWFSRWVKRDVDPDLGDPSAALLNYSLWLHDLTAKGTKDFAQIITALSWLPSRRARQRWTSMVVYLRPSSVDPMPNLVPDITSSFAGASGFTSGELAAGAEQENRRERDRFEEYLASQTAQSLLVRCGRMWGVVFGGQWFVVLDDRVGWHYLAELLHRAEVAAEAISAYDLARARRALIEMPDPHKPKAQNSPSDGDLNTSEDDEFVFFMRAANDVICEGYGQANPADDFNKVLHDCVFDDSAAGENRWFKIVEAAVSLGEVRSAAKAGGAKSDESEAEKPLDTTRRNQWTQITTDTGLQDVLAKSDDLCRLAQVRASGDLEQKVKRLHATHVGNHSSNVRDALVQFVIACRGYVTKHDGKTKQKSRPKKLATREEKDGKAVISGIARCVKFLANLSMPVSHTRRGQSDPIYPYNDRTREAAAQLARHLQLGNSVPRTERALILEMDDCRYVGHVLKADEED